MFQKEKEGTFMKHEHFFPIPPRLACLNENKDSGAKQFGSESQLDKLKNYIIFGRKSRKHC